MATDDALDDEHRTIGYDDEAEPRADSTSPDQRETRRNAPTPVPVDERATVSEHDEVRNRVEAAVAATETRIGPSRPDPMLGTTISGRFQVTERIGAGGMGVVYKARQLGMDRDVAIKMLLKELAHDDKVVQRFKIEALAVSRLNHPNTIRIFDFGQADDGTLYFAMEFLEGVSLERALRTDGPFPARRTLHVIRQVAQSLTEAHEKGIVHRDLKPDNVYLTRVGSDADFVKVLDFGVAKLREADKRQGTLTQAGTIFGTPRYMAPEQCRSMAVDHRADLYAIGVMAYEMLTGKPPFDAENPLGILIKHVQEPPPALAEARPDIEVPDEVEALVMRCLAKAPDERFQTAVELAADCAATEARLAGQFEHVVFVQGTRRPTAAIVQETPTVAGGKAPGRGRKSWWIAGAVAVIAAALGGVWAFGNFAPAVPEIVPTAVTTPAPIIEPAPVPQPKTPLAAAAPMTVSVRFETDPAGAEVVRDGEVLGVTPLARVLPAAEGVGVFVLRKTGYIEREVTAPLDRDASVSVALKAVPVDRPRTAGKPAATPAPPPDSAPAKAPAKESQDGLGRVGDLKKMEF